MNQRTALPPLRPDTFGVKNYPSRSHVDYDVKIQVAADVRSHVWSSHVSIIGSTSTRSAGLGEMEFSEHSLFSVATVGAFRAFNTRKTIEKIRSKNGNQLPRIHLLTGSESFASGLRAFIDGKQPNDFKVGKNFWSELRRALSIGKITIETASADDPRTRILEDWGRKLLIDTREAAIVPSVFLPSVVSQNF